MIDGRGMVKTERSERAHREKRLGHDGARTTPGNGHYWQYARGQGPNLMASPEQRKTLRDRCRDLKANDPYTVGVAHTLANDTIGSGPRLRLNTENETINNWIESRFSEWAREVRLAENLHLMRLSRIDSGESFLQLIDRKNTDGVTLGLNLLEADQIGRLWGSFDGIDHDGIEYDRSGEATFYHILDRHPGDEMPTQATRVKASQVIHYFRRDRPGQLRGIPELAPAINLLAQRRQLENAIIKLTTKATWLSLFLETDRNVEDMEGLEGFDTIDIDPDSLNVLPSGDKLTSVKSESPTTDQVELIKQINASIVRCLVMPYNTASGDSSRHNFASGRLDHQAYRKSVEIEQVRLEGDVLLPIYHAWLEMAIRYYPELYSLRYQPSDSLNPVWYWDEWQHIDPLKQAKATIALLKAGLTTYDDEWGRRKSDFKDKFRQIAKEQQMIRDHEIALDTHIPLDDEEENDAKAPAKKVVD